ncbi:MAG: hypothetical protein H6744_12535 [Deltaproteobacteria bacterium]|nr:hypothetical protein [Deltaproteobacteria bacterium]MCB9787499.1 hypothetical protein [Deltaproteobacteria bacterium]
MRLSVRIRLAGVAVALALTAACGGGADGAASESDAAAPGNSNTAVAPEAAFDRTAPLVSTQVPSPASGFEVLAGGEAVSGRFAASVTVGALQSDETSASGRFRLHIGPTASAPNTVNAPSTHVSP